jgi:hypothetical protein
VNLNHLPLVRLPTSPLRPKISPIVSHTPPVPTAAVVACAAFTKPSPRSPIGCRPRCPIRVLLLKSIAHSCTGPLAVYHLPPELPHHWSPLRHKPPTFSDKPTAIARSSKPPPVSPNQHTSPTVRKRHWHPWRCPLVPVRPIVLTSSRTVPT